MKAIVYSNYGGTEKLQLKEVEKPKVSDNEVLVKVHAASVNSWDWDRLTGKPYFYRLLSGLRKPKLKILGAEVTGVDSQDKLEMIHSLGADHVMDYSTENYVRTGRTYDLIIDVVAS
jgi:NADPH:quinone reductase-like Zn-dependent oxidoreductase